MAEPTIPLSRPTLDEREVEAVRRVIRSGWVMQGPEVAALEAEFAAAVGAPHACAVSSGTAALELALAAVGAGPGREVVTVSHSFVATTASILRVGAEPVLVDVDPATFNVDPAAAEAAIGPRTVAILAVHQMGMPCDLEALARIAAARGVALVEDAACALGSEFRSGGAWEPIGRPRGDVACFSFHPRKVLTCGEGGLLTTARADLDRAFRVQRNQGREVGGSSFVEVGTNHRLTDLQAAIARVQLERLRGLVETRRALAASYRERLALVPGVTPPVEPAWARSNWQSYCVTLAGGIDRDALVAAMVRRGVSSRPGVENSHEEPAFRHVARRSLAVSERVRRRTLLLPLHDGLAERDLDRIVGALADAIEEVR